MDPRGSSSPTISPNRSAAAVRVAGDWATVFDAEITLLHVVEPVVYPEFYAINVALGRRHDTAPRPRHRGPRRRRDGDPRRPTGQHPVLIGRATDTIIAEARPENFDLVVMGTRGLTGLEQLVLGSVAEGVLRRCPVPLLTVEW